MLKIVPRLILSLPIKPYYKILPSNGNQITMNKAPVQASPYLHFPQVVTSARCPAGKSSDVVLPAMVLATSQEDDFGGDREEACYEGTRSPTENYALMSIRKSAIIRRKSRCLLNWSVIHNLGGIIVEDELCRISHPIWVKISHPFLLMVGESFKREKRMSTLHRWYIDEVFARCRGAPKALQNLNDNDLISELISSPNLTHVEDVAII